MYAMLKARLLREWSLFTGPTEKPEMIASRVKLSLPSLKVGKEIWSVIFWLSLLFIAARRPW